MGKAQLIEPSHDPARDALAAHIDRDMKARDLEAATAAVARANTLVDVAETRHGLAKAGLAAWRANQVERLHDAAATGKTLPQESAREARAAAEQRRRRDRKRQIGAGRLRSSRPRRGGIL